MIIRTFLCVLALCGLVYTEEPAIFTLHEGLQPWSEQYHVRGVLSIPYAEINEPFEAWFDAPNLRSRIDYYDGTVKTYQRGDLYEYGSSWTITPMTTETVLNAIMCFEANGTNGNTVTVQGVLPDVTDFQLIGHETYNSIECEVWKYVTAIGDKINRYTLWVKKADRTVPVHYEMRGYDTLLGSHYDKYEVDYLSVESGSATVNASIFNVPTGMACVNFPGPGVQEYSVFQNPMKEFIHNYDAHVSEAFHDFKMTYEKQYDHDREHQERNHIFRNNLRYINSVNRAGKPYRLAVNHLADRTDNEIRRMRGKLPYSGGYNGGQAFKRLNVDVPDSIDWRLRGGVTQVKDQSVCGSCWSFGTTGTIEGANFVKTGKLVRLSQQSLIDCSWGYGNDGCNGGEDFRAYQWIMKHGGIPTEEAYGPYLGNNGFCHSKAAVDVVSITGYVNVTTNDPNALKEAIAIQGPISISIDASHKSLSFYSNGVYFEPKCGNKPEDLDHSVLAVGYGSLDGEPYWLVKNSWSTYWGNDGYVLMSQKDNNCGVMTCPTYVTM